MLRAPAAGLGGICPGPGLVALATLQPQFLVWVAGMVAGMRVDHSVEALMCVVRGQNMKVA